MDFLEQFSFFDILHTLGQLLIIPVVFALFAFLIYTVYSLGSLLVELVVEHQHFKLELPHFVAELNEAEPENIPMVIEDAALLKGQKNRLLEMIEYLNLPEDALTEVAKRLLYDQNLVYQKRLSATEALAKIGPMLGLMGTLIPLGPGIVALASGDTATLSESLMVAFDTTISGLAIAALCYLITRLRRRWYNDYLVSLEAAYNTLLEKARGIREREGEGLHILRKYDAASPSSKSEPAL